MTGLRACDLYYGSSEWAGLGPPSRQTEGYPHRAKGPRSDEGETLAHPGWATDGVTPAGVTTPILCSA